MSETMLDVMSGEGVERLVHEWIANGMLNAANRGMSGSEIATVGLKAAGDNQLLQKIKDMLGSSIPGLGITMIGAAIGSKISGIDFDKILPGNNHSGVREAKFIMKKIAPHVVIGASEGLGDVVDRLIGKFRSPSGTPASEQKAILDLVWRSKSREYPGRLATIERHPETGEILKGEDGVPFITDALLLALKDKWDRENGPQWRERSVRDGKNNNKKERYWDDKGTPYSEYELIPLDVAIKQLTPDSSGMSAKELESLIDGMKKKVPKEWAEKLSDTTISVLLALSATKAKLGYLDRAIGEDFFKDLPDKASIAFMNKLGERFASRIQADGTLTHDDYEAIVEFIDDWMGAELGKANALRRAFARFRAQHRGGTLKLRDAIPLFFAATAPLWIFAMLTIGLFLSSVILFLDGGFHDISKPFHGLDGRYGAFAATLIGAYLIVILLALLAPTQAMLNWVTFFVKDKSTDWLVKTGKKLIAIVAPYGSLLAILVLFGVPVFWRVLLAVTPLAAFGILTILALAGLEPLIRFEAYNSYVWFKRLTIITPFILLIIGSILAILGISPADAVRWIGHFIKQDYSLSTTMRVVISIVLAGAGLVGGAWVINKVELTRVIVDDVERVGRRKSRFARVLVGAIVLVLAALPWIGMIPKHEPAKEEVKVTAPNTPPRAPDPPVTEETNMPRKSVSHKKSFSPPKQAEKKKKAIDMEALCNGLSFDARKQAGCQ